MYIGDSIHFGKDQSILYMSSILKTHMSYEYHTFALILHTLNLNHYLNHLHTTLWTIPFGDTQPTWRTTSIVNHIPRELHPRWTTSFMSNIFRELHLVWTKSMMNYNICELLETIRWTLSYENYLNNFIRRPTWKNWWTILYVDYFILFHELHSLLNYLLTLHFEQHG